MTLNKRSDWLSVGLLVLLAIASFSPLAAAQYDQDHDLQYQPDDPPGRVARLGYIEGSVSMQLAGESDWVEAMPNRPMTIGDKLWADRDSRAEVQLGSAAIRLGPNTGFSFLNLDDRTIQIQLTAGELSVAVRRLNRDDIIEVDTPNQAFSVDQPGGYRVEASEDGNYTVITVREGEGESTGNGQTYMLHAGQRGTFSGTQSLIAEVIQVGPPDRFDEWADNREWRYRNSPSSRYLSPSVVGYDDLDSYGDWRDDPDYGSVWFPNRVSAGWAPYREGHWVWIDPWGWTWVDDSPWGYAPFHYGRWAFIRGRWGWCPGPRTARAMYAPALVVFVGSFGAGNVGWFPLGPREVYVPSYRVSEGYFQRVNITNTSVNTTTVTNVYNTTVVNKSTNITNVTYVNKTVQGAVTAVPQNAFVNSQPVARAAIAVNTQQVASAPVTPRVAIAPTRQSVLGEKAATSNRATAPPPAVMNRAVIAKATPPPPPVSFASKQQTLAAHPGQPLARQEAQRLRPPAAGQPHPIVKQAPPGRPATPNMGRLGAQPNQPSAARPGQPIAAPPPSQPAKRPPQENQPAVHPEPRPEPSQPAVRPEENRPHEPPTRNEPAPAAQPNRPQSSQPAVRPEENRPPGSPPARNERPTAAQPNRPESSQPATRREENRPDEPPVRNDRPPLGQANRPETRTAPPQNERNKPLTPEERKREEQKKKDKDEDRKQQEQEKPPAGSAFTRTD